MSTNSKAPVAGVGLQPESQAKSAVVLPLADGVKITQRDETFYFDEVTLLVEDALFKVPRCYFEQHSEVFKGIFQLLPRDMGAENQSDDQIVYLDGILEYEFRLLLKAIYPLALWGQLKAPAADTDNIDQQPAKPTSWQEWASVLKLSTMWQMKRIQEEAIDHVFCRLVGLDEWTTILRWSTNWGVTKLRDRAIRRLDDDIQGADRISFATECKIGKWLLSGFLQLVEREDEISLQEEDRMGWETTSRLFRLRHQYLQGQIDYHDLKNIIRNEFQTEFHAARYLSKRKETVSMPCIVSKEGLDVIDTLSFDSVIFCVDCVLFKVPWHYFKQNSGAFQGMLAEAFPSITVADGCSDHQPLLLDGIAANSFRLLLRVVFSELINPRGKSISWAEWTDIYKLSDMWLLDNMQENALEHLSSLPTDTNEWITALAWSTKCDVPKIREKALQQLDCEVRGIDRVELAKEYKVGDWLLSGYQELVEREDEISAEEEIRLGRQTTSKLFRVRDRYLRNNGGRGSSSNKSKGKVKGRKSYPRPITAYDPVSDIRRDFQAELETAGFID